MVITTATQKALLSVVLGVWYPGLDSPDVTLPRAGFGLGLLLRAWLACGLVVGHLWPVVAVAIGHVIRRSHGRHGRWPV